MIHLLLMNFRSFTKQTGNFLGQFAQFLIPKGKLVFRVHLLLHLFFKFFFFWLQKCLKSILWMWFVLFWTSFTLARPKMLLLRFFLLLWVQIWSPMPFLFVPSSLTLLTNLFLLSCPPFFFTLLHLRFWLLFTSRRYRLKIVGISYRFKGCVMLIILTSLLLGWHLCHCSIIIGRLLILLAVLFDWTKLILLVSPDLLCLTCQMHCFILRASHLLSKRIDKGILRCMLSLNLLFLVQLIDWKSARFFFLIWKSFLLRLIIWRSSQWTSRRLWGVIRIMFILLRNRGCVRRVLAWISLIFSLWLRTSVADIFWVGKSAWVFRNVTLGRKEIGSGKRIAYFFATVHLWIIGLGLWIEARLTCRKVSSWVILWILRVIIVLL